MARIPRYDPANRYNQHPINPASTDPRIANLGGDQTTGRPFLSQSTYNAPRRYTDFAIKRGITSMVFNDGTPGTTYLDVPHGLKYRPIAHVFAWASGPYDPNESVLSNFDLLVEAGQTARELPFTYWTGTDIYSIQRAETDSEKLTIVHDQLTAGAGDDIIRFFLFFLFDVPPPIRAEYIAGTQS